jgi:hypothetical protein
MRSLDVLMWIHLFSFQICNIAKLFLCSSLFFSYLGSHSIYVNTCWIILCGFFFVVVSGGTGDSI